MQVPPAGTRVIIRYRLPAGSEPPLTDVIGHLLADYPKLQVRTKHGEIVDVDPADVVVLKALPPKTVRTADIRKLEYAAALAWPGLERRWVDGWLLRAANGHTHRGNSAVPLGFDADASAIPTIIDFYAERGLTPWLSLPDRLFRPPERPPHLETVVMAIELDGPPEASGVLLAGSPDAEWLRLLQRELPVEVLTAVVDGEVVFATVPGAGVGRAAVTTAPDGGRWVGLSSVRVDEAARGRGVARRLCTALLAWGVESGATRGYVQVLADNAVALHLYESMGFVPQHRSRYLDARSL
ncbi:Protein N-acetyltransferase, RimJ/RimL family [Mycolicibacterium rutilum]|uniref:Protein N-acetyltransferase, RimJ/RimL family n=1 Tax=Mycolicibacterium rutilum TaxID=370526 RepID=A0A1H6IMA6_MYCRU|nr:GNAT family N-acetyltransferase [Mycolicibacterium rutilum]SEH50202.1 Protein N-acetyltransferase, RimJ/RimL family [Mycolicibacterium rutilum]